MPGVASAIGLVVSDLSVEEVRTRLFSEDALTVGLVQSLFDELEASGERLLPSSDGAKGAYDVVRSVDARYKGQARQLTVDVPDGSLTDDDLASMVKGFADHHEQVYGVAGDGPVELVSFRARVVRVVPKYRPMPGVEVPSDGSAGHVGDRPVYAFELGQRVPTPVFDWPSLNPGAAFDGPAAIEAPDTTAIVPSGWRATIDRWRNLVLQRAGLSIETKEDRSGA